MSDYQSLRAEGEWLLGGSAINIATPLPSPEKASSSLHTYTADTLYGVVLERPPAIIEGFLLAGLSILAGAPKLGKSWLSLWLSICVTMGSDFLGMRCTQGSALYLDLESREYRTQSRLETLMQAKAPPCLHIAHEAAQLDGGLIEQLESWCASVDNPRLIIVDTFVKIKSRARYGENAYEADYRILSDLQSFALKRGVAIIVPFPKR